MPFINSANCGGDTKCECGDVVIEDYIMNEDLYCENNGLILKNRVQLDCNDYVIEGNDQSYGITTQSAISLSFSVKNCIIKDFKYGLLFNYYKARDCIGCPYYYMYPKNSNVNNNTFANNEYGVYSRGSRHIFKNNLFKNNVYGFYNSVGIFNNIDSNYFFNNTQFGVFNEVHYLNIYNNTFANTSIYSKYTKNNQYCNQDNISNFYLGNLNGPLCECIIPLDDMVVDSHVKFCSGKYFVEDLYIESDNNVVDCQGSFLYGNGSSNGIIMRGSINSIIKNCNIFNYTKGIIVTHEDKEYGTRLSRDNIIVNNSIFNVDYGIYITKKNRIENKVEKITNNTIIADKYNICLQHNTVIDAVNNWYGIRNDSLVELKLKGNISYKPYKTNGLLPDLIVLNASLDYKNNLIYFEVKNQGNLYISNFDVKMMFENNRGNIIKEKVYNINGLLANQTRLEKIHGDLKDIKKIYLFLNYNELVDEMDLLNNYFEIKDKNIFQYYLKLDLNNDNMEKEFKNYIYNSIGEFYFTQDEDLADIIISITQNNSNSIYDFNFHKNYKPYESRIESVFEDKIKIYVKSNSLEGYAIGVKNLISNFDEFILDEKQLIIDEKNVNALGDYDYLYSNVIHDLYSIKLIRNLLYDNMISVSYKTMLIKYNDENISYKYKKINSLKSDIFKSYIDKDQYPIVMSRGIYSNINQWDDYAKEIANQGFEVYSLELTGGEFAEQESARDYTFEDLTNKVFPKYIGSIINSSNKNKIKYIGHSNGCRIALKGIHVNGLKNSIDLFIGLGCPILLNEMTGITNMITKIDKNTNLSKGNMAIEELRSEGKKHIYMEEYTKKLKWFGIFVNSKNKISLNLQAHYNDLYVDRNSKFIISNVADKHLFFAGNSTYSKFGLNLLDKYNDDGVVPVADMEYLNDKLDNSKLFIMQKLNHADLVDDRDVLNIIKGELK